MDLHRTAGRVGADAEADQLLLKARRRDHRALPVRRRHQPPRRRDGEAVAVADHDGPRTPVRLPRRPARGRGLACSAWSASSSWSRCTSTRRRAAACTTAPSTSPKAGATSSPRPPTSAAGSPPPRRHDPRHRAQGPAARPSGEAVRRDHHGRQRDHRRWARGREAQGQESSTRRSSSLYCHSQQRQHREADSRTSRRTFKIRARQARSNANRSTGHWRSPRSSPTRTNPGFDAIIGNPPFLGGSKISGAYGDDYLAWLQRWDGNDVKGNADLAARFVLRADRLLSLRGQLGLRHCKHSHRRRTLYESDWNRSRLIIRAGRSPHPWPTNSASLQIVELWASRQPLAKTAAYWLDGEEVPAIGPDLEPYGTIPGPTEAASRERRNRASWVPTFSDSVSHSPPTRKTN